MERLARRAGQDVSSYVRSRVLPDHAVRFRTLIERLRLESDRRRYVLAELNDLLTELPSTGFLRAVSDAQLSGLSPHLQNYVAAMVEQAAHQKGLSAPGWTADVPALERPWFAVDLRSLRPHLLKESPVPFKRRNLFVDAGVGDRV